MTTYYLSMNVGTPATEANVAEATSSPSADIQVDIGGGPNGVSKTSRKWVVQALLAFANYLLTDDPDNPNKAGSGTVPLAK